MLINGTEWYSTSGSVVGSFRPGWSNGLSGYCYTTLESIHIIVIFNYGNRKANINCTKIVYI